ncbi:lipopolysaccharide heptosyltransferase II [Larsenimonas suaedae]|uniref:lipopolysaccharide heptosyltransferase II n=1 Tax=Larsenimonas suaedae TaxID=1851019 RepID=A0ABU1GSI5_9GAMM|nr:lipopolysaccharide heptosyltransferase II [Larsenimonas suaedae]MCM2972672.1 lipopolysaccharide heptosyltransferase II [Larsenimonas suaedae]MDR5894531.1 lipopolysaccharide heptosyltransferase II [Larsenimonas suaedae]
MNARAERILVVGPSWVGDMVMAQSLLKTLKARSPEVRIDVMGPKWSVPILERMPEVDTAWTLEIGHGQFGFKTRWRLARALRGQFDHAIVLPRSWKSALVPFLAGIPHRTGFTGEQRYGVLNERRTLDKSVLDQTVKRFVSLGLPVDEAYPPVEIPAPELMLDADNLARLETRLGLGSAPRIAMMPGAEYGPAKQWPLEYYHALAAKLIARGYEVMVLGGPKDAPAGETIAASLDGAFNLCGETSLADAVDLLGSCEQVVTNDSGLMHVAAATGTRIHAIYGSSSPKYTPPLTDRAVIHTLDLSCSPCFERHCPLGHTDCLNKLSVERIEAMM